MPTKLQRSDGSIMTFDYDGQQFSFFVDQPDDSIEIFHTVGRFYELAELETLGRTVSSGMSILDVGAHVGNHTVYFEKVMRARRVVPIEPDQRAQCVLRTNCALNNLRNVDLSHLGKALGSRTAAGSLVRGDPYHSGSTSIRLDGGAVPVYRGDDLFAGDQFDLIKINAEGMELDVLEGLSSTINRCRPLMFVEVKDHNRPAFMDMLAHWRFHVTWTNQPYPGVANFFAEPTSVRRILRGYAPLRAAHVVDQTWEVARSHGAAAGRSILWRAVVRDPLLLRQRPVLGALRRLHGLGGRAT
jgi:FkbM family methyltransferase